MRLYTNNNKGGIKKKKKTKDLWSIWLGWKSGNIENGEGMEKWKDRKKILVFSHDV